MQKLLCTKNLVDVNGLVPGEPWLFEVDPADNPLKRLQKPQRNVWLTKERNVWNLYSANEGLSPTLRISKENPCAAIRSVVLDYDAITTPEAVVTAVNTLPETQRPRFLEISTGEKCRLVWTFDQILNCPNNQFAEAFIEKFTKLTKADTLLAGFDDASFKPSQVWTNGAVWFELTENNLSQEFVQGVAIQAGKKATLWGQLEFPLEVIAEEVQKRWPGRWKGEFKLDACGVRFWDDQADNRTGCQVKPDGMLCFTGDQSFMRWSQLFGSKWVNAHRTAHLGDAAGDYYFDGHDYWTLRAGLWKPIDRVDLRQNLRGAGISDKPPKGATASDVDEVMIFIRNNKSVEGAAPFVNYPPGPITVEGDLYLNTAKLSRIEPVRFDGDVADACPFIWSFLEGLFARPEEGAWDHFMAHLQRSYIHFMDYIPSSGQALAFCGPRNNGKTLLVNRIIVPLLGGKSANPYDYFTGATTFNEELTRGFVLALNDEESPATEGKRQQFQARTKAWCVNGTQTISPKFRTRVTTYWFGRFYMTLNDDPASVGMLPDIHGNTADKLMFFATQAYRKVFPDNITLETQIRKELPFFAHWLRFVYSPPADVLTRDRMGVKSFFDSHLLKISHHQSYATNLLELLQIWAEGEGRWVDPDKMDAWMGSPTQLLRDMTAQENLAHLLKAWDAPKIAKSLTTLARQGNCGVVDTFAETTSGREFKITKEILNK